MGMVVEAMITENHVGTLKLVEGLEASEVLALIEAAGRPLSIVFKQA